MSDLFSSASSAFAAYATLDDPLLPADPMSALQVRLWRWQVEQFGVPDDRDLVLGIVEECGELEEAGDVAEMQDAVGDVLIYTIQLCTSQRLDFWTIFGSALAYSSIAIAIGQLAHCALKTHQRIRGYANRDYSRRRLFGRIETLIGAVKMAHGSRINIAGALLMTAERVMERDWRRDPAKGGTA